MEMKENVSISQLKNLINEEKYDLAEALLMSYRQNANEEDDELAIIDAAIGEYYGDEERVWEAIRKGLSINPQNPELYLMLGNYYMEKNPQQAYLCYENAGFYCKDEADKVQINEMLIWMKENNMDVRRVSFIILSYNLLDYTRLCINSIRATVPVCAREIVVVDNGSTDGSVAWLREQEDIILVENDENMGFPVGCNQGIEVSSEDTDILLLNNDTILPFNAVFWLRMGLYADSKNGTSGSVSNYVGNFQRVTEKIESVEDWLDYGKANNVPMEYPYENKIFLIGFALLIKREIISQLGGLDERFTPGNSEDEDFGLQVLRAGYKNVLCKNSFIFHFGSKSFGKNVNAYAEVLSRNRGKLNEKWGMDTAYYLYPKMELINLIEEPKEKKLNILDVGCGCGATLGKIKGIYPNACLYGVEKFPQMVELGGNIASIINADIEKMELPWEKEFFDYIILGDSLGGFQKPENVLVKLRQYLKEDGYIVVSAPNLKHYSVLLPLLAGDTYSYKRAGRWGENDIKSYTGKELVKMISCCGYKFDCLRYTMSGEPSEQEENILNRLTEMLGLPDKSTFIAHQYIVKAMVK